MKGLRGTELAMPFHLLHTPLGLSLGGMDKKNGTPGCTFNKICIDMDLSDSPGLSKNQNLAKVFTACTLCSSKQSYNLRGTANFIVEARTYQCKSRCKRTYGLPKNT